MCSWQLSTPVLLFIYKRPEITARVFDEIAKVRPPKLLVVADGPREGQQEEAEKCTQARSVIEQVDWDCEVITNYADVNLGPKERMVSGFRWAFNQIEKGIILEDDCLPNRFFFRFSEELLEKYRDDTRVGAILGSNFQFGRNRTMYSYYFSRFFFPWGWATWKRSMDLFDPDMSLWPQVRDNDWLQALFGNKRARYWSQRFQYVYESKNYCWDYQWFFTSIINNWLSIVPTVNLISNIGFGEGATHTAEKSWYLDVPTVEMQFPLRHPPFMIRHVDADNFVSRKRWGSTPLLVRVVAMLKKILLNSIRFQVNLGEEK